MAQQIILGAQLVPKFQSIRRYNNYDVLQIETLDNLFIAPVNIKVIESFMQKVGYQGVVDKQKKNVIMYPRFTKLIIVDLMKKYPSVPKRLDEDYHSIKDDISLVSVYSTGNVLFRGMLILDAFLTDEIRATDDFKVYETVFVRGRGSKFLEKQVPGETSSPGKLLKVTIKQKQVVEGEKMQNRMLKDKKKGDVGINEMGRTEKIQTPIPTIPRSPRINLSSDKTII
nr:hypothetical protein [Tanacetum cinerariifolium]